MVQVDLAGLGKRRLTTWIEDRPEVKEGVALTLKEYPDTVWKVVKKYQLRIDASTLELNRGWTNNI